MEAKDTVIKTDGLKPYHYTDKYAVGEVGNEIYITEEVWEIDKLLLAQAEITYPIAHKAGKQAMMQEVVEWIEEHFEDVTGEGSIEQILAIPKYKWQAFKKGLK